MFKSRAKSILAAANASNESLYIDESIDYLSGKRTRHLEGCLNSMLRTQLSKARLLTVYDPACERLLSSCTVGRSYNYGDIINRIELQQSSSFWVVLRGSVTVSSEQNSSVTVPPDNQRKYENNRGDDTLTTAQGSLLAARPRKKQHRRANLSKHSTVTYSRGDFFGKLQGVFDRSVVCNEPEGCFLAEVSGEKLQTLFVDLYEKYIAANSLMGDGAKAKARHLLPALYSAHKFPSARTSLQVQKLGYSLFSCMKILPLFSDISLHSCLHMASVLKTGFYTAGMPIVKEGDREHTFYIILSGTASMKMRGMVFGELGMVEKYDQRPDTITAETNVVALEVPDKMYNIIFNADQRIAIRELLYERVLFMKKTGMFSQDADILPVYRSLSLFHKVHYKKGTKLLCSGQNAHHISFISRGVCHIFGKIEKKKSTGIAAKLAAQRQANAERKARRNRNNNIKRSIADRYEKLKSLSKDEKKMPLGFGEGAFTPPHEKRKKTEEAEESSKQMKTIPIARFSVGQYFGDASMFLRRRSYITVVAATDVEIWELPRQNIKRLAAGAREQLLSLVSVKATRMQIAMSIKKRVGDIIKHKTESLKAEIKRLSIIEKYGHHPMLRSRKEDHEDRQATLSLDKNHVAAVKIESDGNDTVKYDPFDANSPLSREARERKRYQGFNPYATHLYSESHGHDSNYIHQWEQTRYGGPLSNSVDRIRQENENKVKELLKNTSYMSEDAKKSPLTLMILSGDFNVRKGEINKVFPSGQSNNADEDNEQSIPSTGNVVLSPIRSRRQLQQFSGSCPSF